MENKYKDALDWVFKELFINNATPKWDLGALGKRKEKLALNTALLQELVDKETPVKPEWLGGAMTGEPKAYCPKCSYCVNDTYLNKYRCRECNQKLDWSDK